MMIIQQYWLGILTTWRHSVGQCQSQETADWRNRNRVARKRLHDVVIKLCSLRLQAEAMHSHELDARERATKHGVPQAMPTKGTWDHTSKAWVLDTAERGRVGEVPHEVVLTLQFLPQLS